MPASHAEVSMTEIPHFRRLVQFLTDVNEHARTEDDYARAWLADARWDDLARLLSAAWRSE